MIALVLLAVIAAVSSLVLVQILRDRQEARVELIRRQVNLLSEDALRHAEAQREVNPDFSGETVTFGPDQQPFGGTFKAATQYKDGHFVADVEYSGENGKIIRRVTP
jgi:type II secretory pathway component PulJ